MSVMVAIKKMKGGAKAPPAKRFHLSAERCGKLDRSRYPLPYHSVPKTIPAAVPVSLARNAGGSWDLPAQREPYGRGRGGTDSLERGCHVHRLPAVRQSAARQKTKASDDKEAHPPPFILGETAGRTSPPSTLSGVSSKPTAGPSNAPTPKPTPAPAQSPIHGGHMLCLRTSKSLTSFHCTARLRTGHRADEVDCRDPQRATRGVFDGLDPTAISSPNTRSACSSAATISRVSGRIFKTTNCATFVGWIWSVRREGS